jgi:hypothetical protein
VRIRYNPYLDDEIVGVLNKKDKVTVFDQSSFTQKIENMESYWYKVRTGNNVEGWVFGGYLTLGADISESGTSKTFDAAAANISASSMLTEKFDKNMYQPVKAYDGKPDTGWMESVPGAGIGESLSISFDKSITVNKLVIDPGWFDCRYWQDNNRIKTLHIELDDYSLTVGFSDQMAPQIVNLPEPRNFRKAKFLIVDVYPSSKDDDS